MEDHCGSSESQHDESFVESTMKVSSHDKTLMGDTVWTICVRDKLANFFYGVELPLAGVVVILVVFVEH